MSLMKRNSNWFSDFFNSDDLFPFGSGEMTARVNIREGKDSYHIELAAPGLKREDFSIEVHGNIITISSEQKDEKKEEKENYTRKEFSYSSFKRSFTLPETVNQDKINAKYEDGLLILDLPKKEEDKKNGPKKISIK